jgi:hypothetical protein
VNRLIFFFCGLGIQNPKNKKKPKERPSLLDDKELRLRILPKFPRVLRLSSPVHHPPATSLRSMRYSLLPPAAILWGIRMLRPVSMPPMGVYSCG